jgi:hypothetical protein
MRTRILMVFAVLGLLVTALPAQTVDVDWVRGTDFTAFKTYAWEVQRGFPVNDAAWNARFRTFIEAELGARGMSRSDNAKFDVIVWYNAQFQQDMNDTSKQNIRIQVALADPSNNRVLWRGAANLPVSGDDAKDAATYRAAIQRMFQRYPPPAD